MNRNYNRNYGAWLADMQARAEVSRRLRAAVFAVCVAVLALLVWLGLCWAAPAFCAYQARVQEELQAEDEGLRAAYDAEMVEGVLRAARLRDNGQAVDASAWRVASEAPATRKGDGR